MYSCNGFFSAIDPSCLSFFFFFNDTATTEIYTLSLHDALPILHQQRGQHRHGQHHRDSGEGDRATGSSHRGHHRGGHVAPGGALFAEAVDHDQRKVDRKSTRLNSSHDQISYAVFCLKKKRSSLMAVNIHITIIELNALHTKRQNLFQELDAVIHLLMEAKHWGLRKSRNATSLNSRFKSLDTLKVKIISVTFRRVIRTNFFF